MTVPLQVIRLNEYILSHEELAHQPERGDSAVDNTRFFKIDFGNGLLNRYNGTFVAYHKGTLCGQSKDGELLFDKASEYYGNSNLAVFNVPKTPGELEAAVAKAMGDSGK